MDEHHVDEPNADSNCCYCGNAICEQCGRCPQFCDCVEEYGAA